MGKAEECHLVNSEGRKMREGVNEVKIGRFRGWTTPLIWGIGLAMWPVIVPGLAVRSQAGPPRDIINRPSPMPTDPSASGDYDPTMMERRLNALNRERQKEMISDTNKLLKLAMELNDEIAANNTGSLTLDQLRKMAQIEKLARNVKEKMAEGVGQIGPSPETPITIPPH
jgi:hypothetical protein